MKALTTTFFDKEILQEHAYVLNRNGTLAIGSTTPTHIMYLLDSQTTDVKIRHLFVQAFKGDVVFELYVNPTILTEFVALEAGTDLFSNKTIPTTRVQKSSVKKSSTLNHFSGGTLVKRTVLSESATGAEGKFFTEGAGSEHGPLLKAGNTLLFKMTNTGAATTIDFHLEFSEDVLG